MVRRLIAGVIFSAALLGGTAAAQNSPPQVLPTTIAPTTSVTVAGVVVERPLPRTGNDFGVQVVVGTGLTGAGLALAVVARMRRQRFNAPAA